MSNFLLEILVEEIPARFQAEAITEFERFMTAEFDKQRISYSDVKSFISPRRIVFSADLSKQTQDFQEEKKGPQVTAPTEVIEKFLKANGVTRENCFEKTIDKKTLLFLAIHHASKNTADCLAEIIKKSISSLSWKKSMHWGSHQMHFVRPIRNILAVFGGKVVDFSFDEIGLKSTNQTVGHRFLAPAAFSVQNTEDYLRKMEENFVVVDREQRRQIVLDEIKSIEKNHSISVIVSEDLMNEVIGLVEYPVVLMGKVPSKFMKLPEEAIITPMKVHQRYFPTRYKDGKLAPYFVFVANNSAVDDGKTIISGNERVLNARLADALFFFETDLQKPLENHLDSLKKITFNVKLGSVFDRIQRVTNLCRFAVSELKHQNSFINENTENLLVRIATLAKCDLSTSMVYEFTELQGIMGAHYARIQGENPEVCTAIREQYLPGDGLSSPISAFYSLIDKIELITSFFAIGKEPTGSKDPFALRRAAISILKIIKKYGIKADLEKLSQKAFEQLPGNDLNPRTVERVVAFIMERFKVLLKDSGIDHDIVLALINSSRNVLLIYQKSAILNEIMKTPKGENLMSGYKRAKNIIGDNTSTEVSNLLFSENAEKVLFDKINELEIRLSEIEDQETDVCAQFEKELEACVGMEEYVSDFFDKVLVNAKDQVIKQNRLNMLTKLVSLFSRVVP